MDALILTDITDIITAVQQPEEVVSDVLDIAVDTESVDDVSFGGGGLTYDVTRSEEEDEELGEELEYVSDNTIQVLIFLFLCRLKREESTVSGGPSAHDSAKERAFCERNHPLVISSVYILRALREFVSSIHKPKKG